MGKRDKPESDGLVALVIDLQWPFLIKMPDERKQNELIDATYNVVKYCREEEIPTIAVHIFGGRRTIRRIRREVVGNRYNRVLSKEKDDAFSNPALLRQLQRWDAQTLILMGIYSSKCVYRTALSAVDRGFEIMTSPELLGDNRGDGQLGMLKWYQEKTLYFPTMDSLLSALR
ncbi:isochorismatase family protein [Candidatus Woesearchaeota archaeon]|nr:isochorismatase family protein [Candidatus Woesearchaeota archaeon]